VQLSREVREHDPRAALFAGEDGLDAYRMILPQAKALLARFAPLFLEIGASQAVAVSRLAKIAGLEDVQVFQDLAGQDRVVRAACVAK
jgi:release factor glutamine methyltransferase